MSATRIWPILLSLSTALLATPSCPPSLEGVTFFCEKDSQCPSPMACNIAERRCVSGIAADAEIQPETATDAADLKDPACDPCAGDAKDGFEVSHPCTTAKECDDGNPCTDDICSETEGCIYKLNAAECAPAKCGGPGPATFRPVAHCDKGVCPEQPVVPCDDAEPCTDDLCGPAKGCYHVNNDMACDDQDQCTLNDQCSGGVCKGGLPPACDDKNPCTDDSCDKVKGCVHSNNASSCDDGDKCTDGDKCAQGKCASGALLKCDDGNLCTDDSCDSAKGCVFSNNSSACDDGNECTLIDKCSGGKCVGTGDLDCDDKEVCTDDSCSPSKGCQNIPNTAPCDDGDACTAGEECEFGTCQSGQTADCDDKNPCTTDSCDKMKGCVNKGMADLESCGEKQVCLAGKCESLCTLEPCPPGYQAYDGCHCRVQPTCVTQCTSGQALVACGTIAPGANFYGQDGHFASGKLDLKPNVNGNNTVTDQKTGLIWANVLSSTGNWSAANQFCNLNSAGLAGAGWRLPSMMELLGIVDYSKVTCPLWDAAFGGCPPAAGHWTSPAIPPPGAYVVVFSNGFGKFDDVAKTEYAARCVRPALPAGTGVPARFMQLTTSSVLDRVTGLTWDKTPPLPLNWQGALNYCKQDGSRLPNVKELASLLDMTKKNCLWDSLFGATCPGQPGFWSSTPAASGTGVYTVSFDTGLIAEFPIAANTRGVRCVKGQ